MMDWELRDYKKYIESKAVVVDPSGFEPSPHVAPLFPFQRKAVDWAIRQGRSADGKRSGRK